MAGVCRASFDVALEAATEHSLATHVVVRARDRLAGWSVLREDGVGACHRSLSSDELAAR
jgi:hypothetical protein